MSEGDRALDFWLAEHVMGYQRIESEMFVSWVLAADHSTRAPFGEHPGYPVDDDVPHYTGRDWPQLAEALQNEPHKFEVCLWFYPAQPWAPAHCEASIWAEGKPSPVAEKSAATPGLALGRAAEQALGGAGQNGE